MTSERINKPGNKPGNEPGNRIRVFLVDDHALFLAGLRAELESRVDIVGSAGDVNEAVLGIRSTQPDVVLLDVHLPGGGGRAVLDGVARETHTTRFLALSVSDAADDVIDVVRGGAAGYVTKTISAEELMRAIERVHHGDTVFSPLLAGFVIDAFRSGDRQSSAKGFDDELDLLTAREVEVLREIARGYAYKQVASHLNISIKTVESHMTSVLRKLQLSSRHELARWAALHQV